MKIKTSELTEAVLDWAVAKADNNGHAMDGIRELLMNRFSPSANWAQGGPIIEREKLTVGFYGHGHWVADPDGAFESLGDTPLVAAMRCYVASKLGEEIEIPEELCNENK